MGRCEVAHSHNGEQQVVSGSRFSKKRKKDLNLSAITFGFWRNGFPLDLNVHVLQKRKNLEKWRLFRMVRRIFWWLRLSFDYCSHDFSFLNPKEKFADLFKSFLVCFEKNKNFQVFHRQLTANVDKFFWMRFRREQCRKVENKHQLTGQNVNTN